MARRSTGLSEAHRPAAPARPDQPVRAGAIALLIIVVGHLAGVHEVAAVARPLPVPRGLPDLEQPAPRLAGADRRGQRGRGRRRRARGGLRPGQGHDGDEGAGLPLHKDATLKIRSRIFLEGNFFVDLTPGTPEGEELEDGDTIPVTRTSTPVQLDELLTALQTNDRESLQDLLDGLGDGLNGKPTAADDRDQDRECARRVRGQVAERLHRPRARIAEGLVAGQPGPCSAPSRTTSRS